LRRPVGHARPDRLPHPPDPRRRSRTGIRNAPGRLADAVDAFCERIGFSHAQTERVFEAARRLGLPVKLHAEQLSDQDGAALVARFGGLSADHLEWLSEAGIAAMAAAGTVAVLLPGAYYFLRETRMPPLDALRAAGVPLAVATDCNPGTSPMTSLLLALNMACTLWRLTPLEALRGCTVNAARALGRRDIGTLEAGKRADLALWDIVSWCAGAARSRHRERHASPKPPPPSTRILAKGQPVYGINTGFGKARQRQHR
jgi:imidazolonepropionase